MRKLAAALAVTLAVPLAAFAQGGPPAGPGSGMGPGVGMGAGPGMMGGRGHEMGGRDPKRARLALTLGLAETLDLDEGQTLKLRESVDRFTQKRRPLMLQQGESMKALRAAATAEKADPAAVDQAIATLHDARAQIQVLDKEFFAAVTKDLPAQKKARAVLFLARFHARAMRGGGARLGPHAMGPGFREPGGPGRTDIGPPGGGELSWADDDLDE
jgi:Spy/CpxP family protein refolding chaperone